MGLVTSCCGRCPNKSRLHSGPERAAYKQGRRLVSASYNAQEFDLTFHQMNVNQASEEELMTLQGVSRNVARNVIAYRHHIGGFRKPEDLALVTGVGATKLEAFRSEIYCGPYAVVSPIDRNPSRTSYHRVNSRISFEAKVNVNAASVPALARAHGVGQELAEVIVRHREECGPFGLLTEIGRIPEVGSYRFELMRNFLTVGESSESAVSTPSLLEMRRVPRIEDREVEEEEEEEVEAARRDAGALRSVLSSPRPSRATQTDQVFLPLAMTSAEAWARPVIQLPNGQSCTGCSGGGSRVRVATWNLQQFGREKAENLGVKEVVCMTILENRLGVVALQELADKEALDVICAELNDPTLAVVRNWPGPRGTWKCVTSDSAGRMFQGLEYNGFLWNAAEGIRLSEWSLLQSPKGGTNGKHFARKPLLGYFRARELDFVLVSVHLKYPGLNNSSRDRLEDEINQLSLLYEALQEHLPDEKDILIVGDFNTGPSSPDFKALSAAGFSHAISDDAYTNISTKNPKGSHCYDNAWFSESLAAVQTGEARVVREGLTHPLIPDNWSWGGVVSDHCPVWQEFYSDQDLDEGVPGILLHLSKVRLLPSS